MTKENYKYESQVRRQNKCSMSSSDLGIFIFTLALVITPSSAFIAQNSIPGCIPQHESLSLRHSALCLRPPQTNEDESSRESKLHSTLNDRHVTPSSRRAKNRSTIKRSTVSMGSDSSSSSSNNNNNNNNRTNSNEKSTSKLSSRREKSQELNKNKKNSILQSRSTDRKKTISSARKKIRAKAKTDKSVTSSEQMYRPSSQSIFQQFEMTQHGILTKEAEFELGSKIAEAKKVRDSMQILVNQRIEDSGYNTISARDVSLGDMLEDWSDDADDDMMYESSILNDNHDSELDILMAEVLESNSQNELLNVMSIDDFGVSILTRTSRKSTKNRLVQDASKLSILSIKSNLNYLSEEDVIQCLRLPGGKKQLTKLLLEGSKARDYLMRSNIRLVVNISKKWFNQNYAAFNADGALLTDLYKGGWDRPTLDEVTQEGVLGLARAVDKYDFSRGLRFSTYATHWITSYVRQCFQRASTGCLHVPAQLHDIKSQYKNVIKRYINSYEEIPGEEEIAKEIGVTVTRLRTAIRVTESLVSIDQPIYSGNAGFKGSGASGDYSGANELILADTLRSTDVTPEDHIEISFLRQCLENAMAAELSPHERDIVRLRLGLDDGNTRSVREVVDVCGGSLSSSDVRSAERRAFKKLSSPNAVHAHNLLEYLEMAGIDTDFYLNNS